MQVKVKIAESKTATKTGFYRINSRDNGDMSNKKEPYRGLA